MLPALPQTQCVYKANTVPDVKASLGFPQEWDVTILTFIYHQTIATSSERKSGKSSVQFCTKNEAKEAVKGQ